MAVSEQGEKSAAEFVAVGRVTKAHGIRGEVKVVPYYGGPADFERFTEFRLVDPVSGAALTLRRGRIRGQDRQVLLELEGIGDRNAAEKCRGAELYVNKEQLPALPEGQYYWHELAGLQVVTAEGQKLGTVSDLVSAGAQDILVITGTGQEYLVPLVKEFIVARDDASRTLTICPPPGLLEING